MLRSVSAKHRRGLTLLELVVVLGILAMLTLVAVQSLEPLADQARFETTRSLLSEVRDATLPSEMNRDLDGRPVLTGMLVDTGRLPMNADELRNIPVGVVAYSVQAFDSDYDGVLDASLASGWNGPYLQPNVGAATTVDGWGRAPILARTGADWTAQAVGDWSVQSLGSDGDSDAPEDDYRADLAETILLRDYTGELVVRLFERDAMTQAEIDPQLTAGQALGVVLIGVNVAGGATGAVEQRVLHVEATPPFEVRPPDDLVLGDSPAIPGLIWIGRFAVRGIVWDDANANDQYDSGETVARSSRLKYLTILPAAETRVELELPAASP